MSYTKKSLNPLDPTPQSIDIVDIAHALSLLCRANGHFPYFYSVAQHSINCMNEAKARGYSSRVQLGCLLHDASEAYISDIIRPVKAHLEKYLDIEKRLQESILEKWIPDPFTEEERKQISDVDDTLLFFEFLVLMEQRLNVNEPPLCSKPEFSFVPHREIEQKFILAFERLTRERPTCSVGVDWMHGQWIAAELRDKTASLRLFDGIDELCKAYENLPHVLIDVPIGLPESSEEAERRPDKAARAFLKVAARKSSVFPVPFRQLIYENDKKEIWHLSQQLGAKTTAFGIGIFPCIRQVDRFLAKNPDWNDRLIESHPECAFQSLNKKRGLQHSKHTEEGISERIAILTSFVSNIENLITSVQKNQREDLLDALCLAVTSGLPFAPVNETVYRDSKGLPMQIVIAK